MWSLITIHPIYIIFRIANFEREFLLLLLLLREIQKDEEQNLEGWKFLVVFFHHSENLQQLQVNVTLILKVNHCKKFFTLVYCHFWKIWLECFNPNIRPKAIPWYYLRMIHVLTLTWIASTFPSRVYEIWDYIKFKTPKINLRQEWIFV